jgi:hypothetical protein
MGDIFTVTDSFGNTEYEGDSLREAYDNWQMTALWHVAYVREVTDMDCGGGVTLVWDDGVDQPVCLHDSSCESSWCDTCNPE